MMKIILSLWIYEWKKNHWHISYLHSHTAIKKCQKFWTYLTKGKMIFITSLWKLWFLALRIFGVVQKLSKEICVSWFYTFQIFLAFNATKFSVIYLSNSIKFQSCRRFTSIFRREIWNETRHWYRRKRYEEHLCVIISSNVVQTLLICLNIYYLKNCAIYLVRARESNCFFIELKRKKKFSQNKNVKSVF